MPTICMHIYQHISLINIPFHLRHGPTISSPIEFCVSPGQDLTSPWVVSGLRMVGGWFISAWWVGGSLVQVHTYHQRIPLIFLWLSLPAWLHLCLFLLDINAFALPQNFVFISPYFQIFCAVQCTAPSVGDCLLYRGK